MQQLLILHGALGAKKQFLELKKLLQHSYEVHCLEFEGHGGLSPHSGPYSIKRFAVQTEATLRALGWEKPMVFGYSMGGYVALKLEAMHPGIFSKIITLGTKFNWTPESAAQEVRMLNPEKLEEKVPSFAYYLKQLHGENDWKSVLNRTADMMLEMGEHPPITEEVLEQIQVPVTCYRGEKDAMVSEAETRWAVQHLPKANYSEIPNWLHPIDKIQPSDLAEKLFS